MSKRNQTKLTRRQSLQLGLASSALIGGWISGGTRRSWSETSNSQNNAMVFEANRKPRNIIFMVSDGMSAGTLTLTDTFSRLVRTPDYITRWAHLMTRPDVAHGMQETFSRDSIVTDSAAAASAWGSGSRINNGALNMLPDGTALTPLAPLVKESGRMVGLVTTTRITHATPAGFAAVQASRDQEDEIAPQYLDLVDVLMGGGLRHFHESMRGDNQDLIGEFTESGYTFWNHRDQVVNGERPERIIGLFADSHMPYTIDHRLDDDLLEQAPTLAEMTRAALESLAEHSEGFLLQVEGGRVDHAAHNNDASAILWDQLAFDDAIDVALDFALRRSDTLVIVTSDHGNANPGLNSLGSQTNNAFEKVAEARISFEQLIPQLESEMENGGLRPDYVSDAIRTYYGVDISANHAQILTNTLNDGSNPAELNRQLNRAVGVLGQIVGNHNGIQFTGTSHTADYVVVSAVGPGQERFAGLRPNTDAFKQIMHLFEIDFSNPTIAPQEVWRRSLPEPSPVYAG